MKKQILQALASFVAVSIPLTWLWLEWGSLAYLKLLVVLSREIHGALGLVYDGKGLGGLSLRFVGQVPFAALVVATPGLSWRQRVRGWWIGALVLFLAHLLLLALADATFGHVRKPVGHLMPFILLNDALPLLIWIVFARDFLGRLVPGLGEGPSARTRPSPEPAERE